MPGTAADQFVVWDERGLGDALALSTALAYFLFKRSMETVGLI